MAGRIAVTGIGIISSIGNNVEENHNALIRQQTGIGKISILETVHKDDYVLGEIKLTHDQLIQMAAVDPEKAWTRTALLGIIAARQAFEDAAVTVGDLSATGLVSASTVGGMDRSELYYNDFLTEARHNKYIDSHHAGNSTEMIAEQLGISEYLTTVSTACSSSLNSIIHGARLLHHGIVKQVIVGGTDALSKFTVNGFNTLMILDPEHCRPFDESRRGLNLGEGAAYLVLEWEGEALKAGKPIHALLGGYANANDAFHQTASSSDGTGPFLAMSGALKKAGLQAADIDYINVHGTGTENNDLTEGTAMKRLFADKVPFFSSTKAFTGHTLGAAGSVESVFSILSLKNNTIFPNINFKQKIEGLGLSPVTEVLSQKLTHVLTNSFGFGGNDSSVVFSKWEKQTSQPALPTTSGMKVSGEASSRESEVGSVSVFINGIGAVSPQNTLEPGYFPENIEAHEERYLQIQKPDFKKHITPAKLRRMSKIVRMGIVAAKTAMNEAQVHEPGAILTGTGMGCQADTEKFLNGLIDSRETLLSPSPFVQSTHNTIGAQIALLLANNNHNLTYVHRTFSFESALLDSLMLIRQNEAESILLGGIDEVTEESWTIKTRIGFYKKGAVKSLQLLHDEQTGSLAGEGAAFFVLSNEKTEKTYAEILGTKTFFRPENQNEVEKEIAGFLEENHLRVADLGLVMQGYNGDRVFDSIYENLEEKLFAKNNTAWFKHLCGEYDPASSFSKWIAAEA
ncbi:MAG: beta-ketoacyl-[acyl-carrier-protein] synthase family protein, partial [Bacteroidales bacterium]|nr:beta-ketoacyl-[acyl-carrier-protein] synthase family protein [Bacteroidales bacterium]